MILKMEYELIRSKRKTISISISKNIKVIVRAPLRTPIKDIDRIVAKHNPWIEKNKSIMKNTLENTKCLDDEEIKDLKKKAKEVIPNRVKYYSNIMRVTPENVKITSATTRWGSCSGKNNLCFSYRVMLLPMEIIDYIVVHELAHIRVKNHSKSFYEEVKRYMPDYEKRVCKLKIIQKQIPR